MQNGNCQLSFFACLRPLPLAHTKNQPKNCNKFHIILMLTLQGCVHKKGNFPSGLCHLVCSSALMSSYQSEMAGLPAKFVNKTS